MSVSASARLICGVKVEFESEEFEATVTRFNPRNGDPIELKSPAFHLTAILPDGEKIKLDDDTEAFVDEKDKGSYRHEEWNRRRFYVRVEAWLKEKYGLESDRKGFSYWDGYRGESWNQAEAKPFVLIGIEVLTGSSWKNPLGETTKQNLTGCFAEAYDAILPTFGVQQEKHIAFYLQTILS
jgi:hypothetical protein